MGGQGTRAFKFSTMLVQNKYHACLCLVRFIGNLGLFNLINTFIDHSMLIRASYCLKMLIRWLCITNCPSVELMKHPGNFDGTPLEMSKR